MDAKILVFVICVEVIIYLLLYNLHDCTIKISSISLKSVCLTELDRTSLETVIHRCFTE